MTRELEQRIQPENSTSSPLYVSRAHRLQRNLAGEARSMLPLTVEETAGAFAKFVEQNSLGRLND